MEKNLYVNKIVKILNLDNLIGNRSGSVHIDVTKKIAHTQTIYKLAR
jgi:hypothetical protein